MLAEFIARVSMARLVLKDSFLSFVMGAFFMKESCYSLPIGCMKPQDKGGLIGLICPND